MKASLKSNVKDRSLPEKTMRVLVCDRYALSIISSACRVSDLLTKNISVVETLEKSREAFPSLEVVYFVSPTEESAKEILSDIDKKKYLNSHIFFTNIAPKSVIKIIGSTKNSKSILTCVDFNLDFLAVESSVFNFRETEDMKKAYFSSGDFDLYTKYLADRLMSFCLTVKEFPYIRYNVEKSKHRQISQQVSLRLKEKMDEYRKTFKNDLAKSSPKSLLLVVDRSVDAIAPLLHEFTYQAMTTDLVGLEKGCIYSFKTTNSEKKEVTKKIIFDENDKIWQSLKNKHIAEVNVQLSKDLKDFAEKNGMLKDKKDMSLEEVGSMIRKLPEYNHLATHKKLAQSLMETFKKDELAEIAKEEQNIVTGKDSNGKTPSNLANELTQIMKKTNVSNLDKLRLLMAFTIAKGPKETRDSLMELVRFSELENNALTNILTLKPPSSFNYSKLQTKYSTNKPQGIEFDFSLSRYAPVIKELCEDALKGNLSEKDFKYIETPSSSFKLETVTTQKKNDYKLYVFVIGGISYSEIRSAYELQNEYGIEVIIGGTSILSPSDYIQKLENGDDILKKSGVESDDEDELSA